MKRLYFIRHGESEGNEARVFSGQWDTPLTDLGRSQAEQAAQQADELIIDVIISSPLIRASETAEIIAKHLGYPTDKIILSDLLMERSYGNLQQQSYDVIGDNFNFDEVENIELEVDVVNRAARALALINKVESDNILIVAHASIGRALRQEIMHNHSDGVEVAEEFEIPNCKIIQWI